MSKVTVSIGELPGAIRESARAVLVANGFELRTADGRRLIPAELDAFLRELGNNAAQTIVCLDGSSPPDDEPPVAALAASPRASLGFVEAPTGEPICLSCGQLADRHSRSLECPR